MERPGIRRGGQGRDESADAVRRRLLAFVGLATLPVSGCIGWFACILDLWNVAPRIGL
jgi:hypothetical protein